MGQFPQEMDYQTGRLLAIKQKLDEMGERLEAPCGVQRRMGKSADRMRDAFPENHEPVMVVWPQPSLGWWMLRRLVLWLLGRPRPARPDTAAPSHPVLEPLDPDLLSAWRGRWAKVNAEIPALREATKRSQEAVLPLKRLLEEIRMESNESRVLRLTSGQPDRRPRWRRFLAWCRGERRRPVPVLEIKLRKMVGEHLTDLKTPKARLEAESARLCEAWASVRARCKELTERAAG